MDEKVLLGAALMVDLERCPIEDFDSSNGTTFLRAARERFLEDGLCTLPGFMRPEALEILTEEANGCIRDAWFCRNTHSVYLTEAAPDVPTGDVATRQERTFVGSIPYDRIGEHSSLRRLYLWEPLKDFVGAVFGKPRLHRFADPLGACSVNVFVDGGEHGWHFDESEFSVTLMVQPPESGGVFEYVPHIRGRGDEKSIVEAVLDGDRRHVRELAFGAGTLLIFAGHQTLHRVTRVSGARPRLVPVLAYAERPGLRTAMKSAGCSGGVRGARTQQSTARSGGSLAGRVASQAKGAIHHAIPDRPSSVPEAHPARPDGSVRGLHPVSGH